LANRNASESSQTLMNFLVSQYGNYLLSGQQGPASYAWIQANVGESPTIIGLDMTDCSPSRVEHGTNSTAVEDAIAFDKNGTIVNFCWHWNAPAGLIDSDEYPWWRGFYTEGTTFDLAAALADKSSGNYSLLIRDMDVIAGKLKLLQEANIPVVWRPLHEAEGGWVRGRDKKPEPTKELYRIMYDRMTNNHGLNNLIWVWNSVSADWYPGDDVVDILSYDSYPTTKDDHGPVTTQYSQLISLGQDKKLVTLAEVGPIPDPDLLQTNQTAWSYFVTWEGEFITDGTHNSMDFLKKVYSHQYVYNWDDIRGWKGTETNGTTSPSPITPTSSASATSTTPTVAPTNTMLTTSNSTLPTVPSPVSSIPATKNLNSTTLATGYTNRMVSRHSIHSRVKPLG
ncbi:hypothetical protein CPB86DRAFT_708306, partial [Serendipita vermifera]